MYMCMHWNNFFLYFLPIVNSSDVSSSLSFSTFEFLLFTFCYIQLSYSRLWEWKVKSRWQKLGFRIMSYYSWVSLEFKKSWIQEKKYKVEAFIFRFDLLRTYLLRPEFLDPVYLGKRMDFRCTTPLLVLVSQFWVLHYNMVAAFTSGWRAGWW